MAACWGGKKMNKFRIGRMQRNGSFCSFLLAAVTKEPNYGFGWIRKWLSSRVDYGSQSWSFKSSFHMHFLIDIQYYEEQNA